MPFISSETVDSVDASSLLILVSSERSTWLVLVPDGFRSAASAIFT